MSPICPLGSLTTTLLTGGAQTGLAKRQHFHHLPGFPSPNFSSTFWTIWPWRLKALRFVGELCPSHFLWIRELVLEKQNCRKEQTLQGGGRGGGGERKREREINPRLYVVPRIRVHKLWGSHRLGVNVYSLDRLNSKEPSLRKVTFLHWMERKQEGIKICHLCERTE